MSKIYAVNEISAIIAPIVEALEIERVWLFGSYARGEASEDSDILICGLKAVKYEACLVWEGYMMS